MSQFVQPQFAGQPACVYQYPTPVKGLLSTLDSERLSSTKEIRCALMLSYLRFQYLSKTEPDDMTDLIELNDMADALREAKVMRGNTPRRSRQGSFCAH